MKQMTIRLNGQGEIELEKIKEMYDLHKNAPAVEMAILNHRRYADEIDQKQDEIENLKQQIAEMQAVINYLENK
ncbi:MAG: hypothetical protein EOM12_15485 [Verrucomicrobiae bacterium]|nr:hypothetical protein [Verrucomicrobiae bacterium]